MDSVDTSAFFDGIFQNARQNAVIIMQDDGTVEMVNGAFTAAFGYTTDDLKGKHFRVLYIEKDQITKRPEIELNQTHREGSGSDENYLVHKDGTPVWVTGEAILVASGDKTRIVKIIHNIHAQKQLERYLLSSAELLDSLFESVQGVGLLLLTSQMKVIKANTAFRKLFHIEAPLTGGCKLLEIGHPFWSGEEVKQDIRNAIVNGAAIKKEYIISTAERQYIKLLATSKLMVEEDMNERQLLLILKEA